jgi:6-phosphogluconolactonase
MNPNAELLRAANDTALAEMVAERWLPQLKQPYAFAVSGGRIAVKFFQALAVRAKGKLCHPEINLFFADERCVPRDHSESNFRLVEEHLINTGAVAVKQVHRIAGERIPHMAADAASGDLLETCLGVLDMIFLGMGEDGHIASLFPGDPLLDSPDVYRAVVAPKPPPNRVTLGLALIARAKNVWVLASGPGKETALQRSLAATGDTPLARLLTARKETLIFTDVR